MNHNGQMPRSDSDSMRSGVVGYSERVRTGKRIN